MALGELGCPSLEYVYSMTWAEFRIRLFSYNRREKKDWYKVREIAFAATMGPHLDPKHLPKSKDAFINIENNKKEGPSEVIIARIRQAQEQYKKDLKDAD
jgi:hypothetical protein